MVYRGFCDKQNKDYSVEVTLIPTGALEDNSVGYTTGRMNCMYASLHDCCNGPKQCSILKNLNK